MEKIIESALKYPDQTIYTGKRHSDCFQKAIESSQHSIQENPTQGFITNQGRFVDRKEARKIAIESHQCSIKTIKPNELLSEDLW